ncbi:MAG TPA: hypothetical protein VG013_41830 [Gemmataceae bacterium]|jgi:hypothetical protein|nr:hypothetical protein [Gemmataceae bacterium]
MSAENEAATAEKYLDEHIRVAGIACAKGTPLLRTMNRRRQLIEHSPGDYDDGPHVTKSSPGDLPATPQPV